MEQAVVMGEGASVEGRREGEAAVSAGPPRCRFPW